jgi:tRNA G46 methylase TrmB
MEKENVKKPGRRENVGIKSQGRVLSSWQMALRNRLTEFMLKLSEERRYRIEDLFFMRIGKFFARRFGGLFLRPLRGIVWRMGYLGEYIPKEGDVVIDVGAYTGDTALIFSRLVGEKGRVIAFEPDSYCFQKLVKNIKALRLKNVVALKKIALEQEISCEIHRDKCRGLAFSV